MHTNKPRFIWVQVQDPQVQDLVATTGLRFHRRSESTFDLFLSTSTVLLPFIYYLLLFREDQKAELARQNEPRQRVMSNKQIICKKYFIEYSYQFRTFSICRNSTRGNRCLSSWQKRVGPRKCQNNAERLGGQASPVAGGKSNSWWFVLSFKI